jgi:hypothetical protein
MININEPKIIANTQIIKFNYLIITTTTNGMRADVFYNIFDENNKLVDEVAISYEGVSFNAWWAGFNSGTFLYEQYAEKNNINETVPNSEVEFEN